MRQACHVAKEKYMSGNCFDGTWGVNYKRMKMKIYQKRALRLSLKLHDEKKKEKKRKKKNTTKLASGYFARELNNLKLKQVKRVTQQFLPFSHTPLLLCNQ